MNKYDGLYIFAGSAKDDVLDKQIDKARGEITRLAGNVLNTEVFGKKTFARPMRKRDSGVYVKIRFELDPAMVSTLVTRYHLVEDIFRVQILAVDERREAIMVKQIEVQKVREATRAAAAAKEAANQNAQEA
jgi:small subunit ribosomal protein S6